MTLDIIGNHERKEGLYRFSKEMLNFKLGIKEYIINIEYDSVRGALDIYVMGDDLPVIPEGGTLPNLVKTLY